MVMIYSASGARAGHAGDLTRQPVGLVLELSQRDLHRGELLLEGGLAVTEPAGPFIDLVVELPDHVIAGLDRRGQRTDGGTGRGGGDVVNRLRESSLDGRGHG